MRTINTIDTNDVSFQRCVLWGRLIMGERRRAVASLWLEHVPSIGLAIGPRQKTSCIFHISGN